MCVRVTGITPFVCKGEQTTQETDRIQVDCYAESYREAYLIYRTVRSVLDNLITTLDDGTEIYISIADAQDLSVQQMIELGFIAQKGLYGIMSFFNAEVKLAELT